MDFLGTLKFTENIVNHHFSFHSQKLRKIATKIILILVVISIAGTSLGMKIDPAVASSYPVSGNQHSHANEGQEFSSNQQNFMDRTYNNGSNSNQQNQLDQNPLPPSPKTLTQTQSEGSRVWAGTNNAGIWLLEGSVWQHRSSGLGGGSVNSIRVDPYNHDVLLAVVGGQVYRTTNAGQNWSAVSMPFQQNGWNRVFWDRATPGEVVISGPDKGVIFNTDPRAAISHDGGETWSGIDLYIGDGMIAKARPGDLWGLNGIWYMTGDDYNNIALGWPCHRKAIWRSTDHGHNWELLCNLPKQYWYVGTFLTGHWDDPGHLLAVFDHAVGNPVLESTTWAESWTTDGQYFQANRQILNDPVRGDTIWLAAQGRIYRSPSGNKSFTQALSLDRALSEVAVDGYQGVVYGAGEERRMAYSLDGSTGWTRIDIPVTPPAVWDTDIVSLAVELPPIISIPDRSDQSDCQPKDHQGDLRECQVDGAGNTQGFAGDPINTHTGGFHTITSDLSFNTAAGPLLFQRTYSSRAIDLYSDVLGYGWTHNHDTRLIFPEDPQGEEGIVWFKAHTANQYRFTIIGDGQYTPYPGVLATLSRENGPPLQYILTDRAQQTYTFDEDGKLLTWTNAVGNGFHYQYDGQGRLSRVNDESASRYLTFTYDSQDRITMVGDHTGRSLTFSYNASGDLRTMTDVFDGTWTYTYDASHRLTHIQDPRGITTTRVVYDGEGRAIQQFNGLDIRTVDITYGENGTTTLTNPLNYTTTHVYDEEERTLIQEIDPLGRVTYRAYDDHLRPASITNPLSDTNQLAWSEDGHNLEYTIDPLGNVTEMIYNETNRLTLVRDPLGRETEFHYTGALLDSIEDALDYPTSFFYTTEADAPQPPGLLKKTTDALLNDTQFIYNAFGDCIQMIDAFEQLWTYTYNDLGWLLSATDPMGITTKNEYDDAGRIIKVVQNYNASRPQNDEDQYNIITQFQYDLVGNLTHMIDTYDRVTFYEYDDADQLLAMTENYRPGFSPDQETNVTTQFRYDDVGNPIAVIDPLGAITRTYYDALDRPITVVQNLTDWDISNPTPPAFDPDHPDQNVPAYYDYDAAGNLISIEDALGTMTRTCYDERSLPIKSITNPTVSDPCPSYSTSSNPALDIINSWTYDEVGNAITWTDPLGNITHYLYDLLNRRVQVVNPLQYSTSIGFDEVGNLSWMSDAESIATLYEYDALHRIIGVIENWNPDLPSDHETNVLTQYVYDPIGNLIVHQDAHGEEWSFQYDLLNRMIVKADPIGNMWAFAYDALGNLTHYIDAEVNTTTYTYDALNRLLGINYPEPDSDVTFTYDASDNRLSMSDGLGTTTWTYDGLYRPTTITSPFGQGVGYAYDALGNRTGMTYPDGKTVTYAYDAAQRLVQVQDWDTHLTSYTYDKTGSPIGISLPNGITSNMTWDEAGWLDSIEHTFNTQTLAYYEYVYDRVGNKIQAVEYLKKPHVEPELPYKVYLPLISKGGEGSPGTTINYTYDPLYRLTAADYSSGEFFHYTYDAVGDRLSETTHKGTKTYQYNGANQIIDVNGVDYNWDRNGGLLSDGERTFTYNHADRLTSVSDGSSTCAFTYDGLGNRYQQSIDGSTTTYSLDIVADLAQVLGDGENSYLYSLARIGEAGASGWQYPLSNALGSARQLTDSSGDLTLTHYFEPFGAPMKAYGDGSSDFGFTGEQDSLTDLVFLRARYYDPGTGRFITKDPFPGVLSLPSSLHPYQYALNNPINLVDPSGEFIFTSLIIAAGIGALIGGIGGAISYAMSHPGSSLGDLINSGCFWRQVGIGAAVGAISGLAAGAVTGILGGLGIVGTGFWSTVFLGGISGAISGGVSESVRQLLTYGRITNPGSILAAVASGALSGAIFAGVGYGIGKMIQKSWGAKSTIGTPEKKWLEYVPNKYRRSVSRAFEGTPKVEMLSDDMVVYRHWGGKSSEVGSPWFSIKEYIKPGNARRYLALPEGNTAIEMTRFLIPKDTLIIRGKVASQVGTIGFGDYAVGGGIQVYLPDLLKAIALK